MDINGVPVGLSDAERRERAAALRRTQAEKERKMRELHMEFKADRTLPRTSVHSAASAREQQAQHEEASASREDAAVGGAARPLQPLLPAAGSAPSAAAAQGNRAAALAAAEARAAAAAAAAGPAASTAPAAATKRTRIVEPPRSPQRPEFQQGGISEDERKLRAEEIKRQQAERERARQRIASEFRSDHNIGTSSESAPERGGASSEPATSSPAQPSHGSSAVISLACLVQLRLPGGEVTQQEFQASDLLSSVVDWAQLVLRQHGIYESCKLVLPPRQVLGENDVSKTLCELQFLPRVSFNLQLQSASGVVTQAPRAGSEFESAFVVEVTAMLESDGFTSWEAQEWGLLVHSQVGI